MTRKPGDINYENYVGYQAFSSDMPVHRINKSNWYLKFENSKLVVLDVCTLFKE